MKKLVLVNEKDEMVGLEEKEKCHRGKGILHRAFSIYIFNNKGQLLIQQRSKFKKLWPNYWSNSCCSHPREREDYIKAGKRRLKEELGFNSTLKFITKFQYQAKYKDIGSENELCTILVGYYNGKVKPNPKEVADWQWIDVNKLRKDFKKNPENYTLWFKIGLEKVLNSSLWKKKS